MVALIGVIGVLLLLQENLEQSRLFLMNQCLKHFIDLRNCKLNGERYKVIQKALAAKSSKNM